jgi:hypothetical protein
VDFVSFSDATAARAAESSVRQSHWTFFVPTTQEGKDLAVSKEANFIFIVAGDEAKPVSWVAGGR